MQLMYVGDIENVIKCQARNLIKQTRIVIKQEKFVYEQRNQLSENQLFHLNKFFILCCVTMNIVVSNQFEELNCFTNNTFSYVLHRIIV